MPLSFSDAGVKDHELENFLRGHSLPNKKGASTAWCVGIQTEAMCSSEVFRELLDAPIDFQRQVVDQLPIYTYEAGRSFVEVLVHA